MSRSHERRVHITCDRCGHIEIHCTVTDARHGGWSTQPGYDRCPKCAKETKA